jgi:hypothetical protein
MAYYKSLSEESKNSLPQALKIEIKMLGHCIEIYEEGDRRITPYQRCLATRRNDLLKAINGLDVFLSKIILHEPNFLFNYTNIGYQSYFVDSRAIELMKQMSFDIYRLGDVRADLEDVEPMIRNADFVSIDISAVRQSDAPANANASPNGFYGEEMCKITRYAGLSDKLSMIGFFENNPAFDVGGQTSHLIAQMIWYFIQGFSHRKNDLPHQNKKEFKKYVIPFKEQKQEIVFLKSKKSDRWWMEVPCPSTVKEKYKRHYLLPCSYRDYEIATKEEIPDRWWQAYQKLI